MSFQSLRRALQNETEFLWRLCIVLAAGGLIWLWIDDLRGAIIFGSMPVGLAVGHAFAHGQRIFRQKLHSIGVWTIGIGAGLFICVSALAAAFAEQPPGERDVVWYLLVTLAIVVAFFGLSVRAESKKL